MVETASYGSNINIGINFALRNVAEENHDKNRSSGTTTKKKSGYLSVETLFGETELR
jgi:hypothetical protein